MIVAWDLETCPLPLERLSAAAQRRLALHLEKDGEADALRFRSLHPALGWICCLSVRAASDPACPRPPKSYLAATPDDEASLLAAFWDDLAQLGRRRVTWVTFNGKNFDVEFLLTRTLAHGLLPSRTDLLDRYPYGHQPHCDLMTVWRRAAMRLDDVCDLLGVDSPKTELDGSGVGAAVAEGRLADVARYCEADVAATLACYARIAPALARRPAVGAS